MYGLDKYSAKVLEAWERVPEDQRELLWYGGALTFGSYRRIMDDIYRAIYSRTEHRIEGWEENEWMALEWSVDGRGEWRAVGDLPKLPAPMRQMGRLALQTEGLSRLRRMSPAEVWERHAGGLARLPHWAVCDFLGDECYRTVRVGHNGLIEFQDRDMTGSARKLRYAGAVAQPDGSGCRLAPGAEYGLYVLPHDMTKAVVVEAKTRAVLGVAPMWSAVDPLNAEQVGIMQEAQARMIAAQTAPLQERHAERSDELAVRREQNDLLLADLTAPVARKKSPQKKRVTTGKMLHALASARNNGNNATEETGDEW